MSNNNRSNNGQNNAHTNYFSIEGKVMQCIFKDGSVFTLMDSKNQVHKCQRRGFSAVPGMTIAGRVRSENTKYGEQLTFVEEPKRIVNFDIEKNIIIDALHKPIQGFGSIGAKKLYDVICSQGIPLVIMQKACVFPEIRDWLCQVVSSLKLKLNSDDVDKILLNWQKNESHNFLVGLGIDSRKIKKYSKNPELIKIILMYPFTFYELSVQECIKVCEAFGVKYNDSDIEVAGLARHVHQYTKQTCSTYAEVTIEPNFLTHNDSNEYLDKHNLLHISEKTYAFKSVYYAEQKLGTHLKNMLNEEINPDWEEYFSEWKPKCKTLASEQIEAIKGSVSNHVSIITGPAGSGKTTIISEIVNILLKQQLTFVIAAFTGKATFRVRESLCGMVPDRALLTFTLHSLIYKKQMYKKRKEQKKNSLDYDSFSDDDDDESANYSGDNLKTINSIPDYVVEEDPEYLIVDESSMVTGQLLYKFLVTFPNIKHIILIGDPAQLEPFSNWGRPFHHMCISTEITIPIYHLKQNFRSTIKDDNGNFVPNGICLNAEKIRAGSIESYRLSIQNPSYNPPIVKLDGYATFIQYTGKNGIDIIMKILNKLNNDGYRSKDIKILCPSNDKVLQINTECQNFYSKNTIHNQKITTVGTKKFCIGDRVIVTRNNYKIGLFNGSEGSVVDIDQDRGEIKIQFENNSSDVNEYWFGKVDKQTTFNIIATKETIIDSLMNITSAATSASTSNLVENRTVNEIDDIQLAYALTIHRSQGSEWMHVIVYVPYLTRNVNRNMIYTAITRGKKVCFCIDENQECIKATGKNPEPRKEFFATYL